MRYALTLEHLEDKFYREGLANFTLADFMAAGFDETFYINLQAISAQETTHVTFLTGALVAAGQAPTVECTYAFGITSVKQFVATANIFEGLGTSAYLGAAAQITNKGYLTAAGSVLTIEARHSAYLRASLSQTPYPQAQDDPLTPDEVFTMAHGFITSCPANNPALPIKSFPGISVTTSGTIISGQLISLQTSGYALAANDVTAKLYAAFVTAGGPLFAPLLQKGDGVNFQITVPTGVNGQSYVVLTNCNDTVSDNTVVAGQTFLEYVTPHKTRKVLADLLSGSQIHHQRSAA